MIFYKEGYDYQLYEDYEIQTDIYDQNINEQFITIWPTGELVIRKGFAWDGASGSIDTDTNRRASLVHDAICDAINNDLLPRHFQKNADRLFKEICKSAGMSGFREWHHNKGVSWFSKSRFKKFKPRPILTAP